MKILFRPFLVVVLAVSVAFLGFGCSKQDRKEKHIATADAFYAAGDLDKAEIEYLNVLKLDNSHAHSISRLGMIYSEQGRVGRVMAFLLKARELQPNNPDIRVRIGLITLATGNVDGARREALVALEHRPDDPDAPLLIAETATKPEDIPPARAAFAALPPAARDTPAVVVALGMLDLREGRVMEAFAAFERALAKDLKFPPAYSALAHWHSLKGDTAKSEKALQQAAENSPLRSPRRLQYARALASRGNADGARAELDKITSKVPDYLPAWIVLAEFAANEKKLDEAQTHLARVLARDPLHPEAMLMNARVHFAKGDRAKAMAEMEKMLRAYPHSAQALFYMATLHNASGDTQKAIASLKQATALAPAYAEAVVMLAELDLKRGEPRLASDGLAPLVKQRPDLLDARMLLANAYKAQDRHNEALAIYTDLAKTPDQALQAVFMKATVLEQQNRREDARAAYHDVLALQPEFLPAYERLVALDVADKKYDAAMARTNEILAKNPKSSAAYMLQAYIHLAQNQVDQAEAAMLKAVKVEPSAMAAYFALARLYIDSNRIDKALANFESVVAKNPKNFEVWMIIGSIHDQQKNFAKARDAYEKLLAVNPNFSPALNNLAYLYSEHFNELAKAQELAQRSREQLPNDPHVADTLGWILAKQGQYARAAALLTESEGRLPESAEVQYHLGAVQYMMGADEVARQALKRAIDSKADFPGKEDAAQRLAILNIDPATAPAGVRADLEKRIAAEPKDTAAMTRLAAIQARAGESDKAFELLQRVIRLNPNHVQASLTLVQLQVQRGDSKAALELARNIRKAAPEDPEVARALGVAAFRTGDHAWSYSLLQEVARRIVPNDPGLQFDLAKAAYSVGRVDEAEAGLQRVAQVGGKFLGAEDAKQLSELIALSRAKDRSPASEQAIETALRADANSVPALFARAIQAEHKGDAAAAIKDYEKVLSIYPEFTPAKRGLAILTASTGDVQATYQLAVKSREAFPNDPALEKAIGVLLYRQKDFNRAASTLQSLATSRPDDGELNYYLGMAQAKLNRNADSKKNLEKALAQNLKAEHAAEAKQTLANLK